MAITNYTDLQSAIADFLNRDDLAATIPTFISLAEADINRSVRHWRMEKRSTAELDTQYSAIPADFLEVIRFYITSNDTRPLELISQAELLDRKYRNLDTSGKPAYYAITAGEIEVYPVPDGTYDVELYYYARTPALSVSEPTNWLLTYFPDAYLYSALIHSAPYLQEDSRIQTWAALQQNAINAINAESEKSKFGGAGRRLKIRAY
jgi:hypothetical protein